MPASVPTIAEHDALAAALAVLESRVTALETPIPPPPTKTLLTQADFTYLGSYKIPNNLDAGGSLAYGQGFTLRRVAGELRFLTFSFAGNVAGPQLRLVEFAEPAAIGGIAQVVLNVWPDIFGNGWNHGSRWHSLSWDEIKQKL